MNIVFAGPATVSQLAERFKFDRPFPRVGMTFSLGTELVYGLVKRGHHVSVITTTTPIGLHEVFHAEGCDVYIVPEQRFTHMQYPTLFALEMRGIRDCIREVKPDVVFAHWLYFNAYAGITSGYPTLVVAHDSPWRILWTCRSLQSIVKAFYAQLFVFPKLKYVTAVSPHIVDDLLKLNRFKGYIPVVPNGIDVRDKSEGERRKIIRKDAKTVVCVSQMGRLKNTQTLVKAFDLLRVKHPDWRLIMYGQGLKDGLATREQIDKVLREEADVFCSPSLEESFGMVFVEAMLHGVPCVGGEKSGAVPWVMGEGGVTCNVTKPEKLAACLEKVMLDYELRKKLSENGVRRVMENFDIERVVDLYEQELKRVASEKR